MPGRVGAPPPRGVWWGGPTRHRQWALWPRGSRNIRPPGRRGRALLPGSFPAERILRHELFLGGCPHRHPHRTGAGRPEGHPGSTHSVQRTGEGALSRELLEAPGFWPLWSTAHLTWWFSRRPGGQVQGLRPSLEVPGVGRAWAPVSVISGCLCAWPTDPHTEVGSCVDTKGSQQWGSCPNVPAGRTPARITGFCPIQPASCLPRITGHPPTPGAGFGTERPHCPASRPPPGPGQHRGTGSKHVSPSPRGRVGPFQARGRGRDSCNEWHDDSFLELKTNSSDGRALAHGWMLALGVGHSGSWARRPAGWQGGGAGS